MNYRPVLGNGVFMMSDIVSDLSSYCEVGETDTLNGSYNAEGTRYNEATEVSVLCVCLIMEMVGGGL